MDYKIHIAYGFHVNCYHSYRGDTNDAQGFGSDLRIIRKTIAVLDRLNSEGIPVKGTWDSDNFFSLGKILPEYAPDILEGMARRARENGDEHIIMGYSNGALGAMQADELAASVNMAVSNGEGSGLEDLFGSYKRIVRPQEMMFTPSQVRTYNALGVKALCLYYSCVPFDGFRTLIKPLAPEKAFNPLTFEYEGEGLTVIPTYSNADVCDAGCLRAWVRDLRAKQLSGEVKSDLFLFINMDADAIFWESLDLPLIGGKLANTDGINGLVREVADLDYVVFDTPGGYLENHGPAGKITFTQDTADGNFTGYASWAEKPYNRKIWTAVERSRAAAKAFENKEDFSGRIKLLSTTHFGLATPVLNIQREKAADSLAAKLIANSVKSEGELTVHNTCGGTLMCAQFACGGGMPAVEGEGLEAFTAVPLGDDSVFALMRFGEEKEKYGIKAVPYTEQSASPFTVLESAGARLECENGRIKSFSYNGRAAGGEDFITSYLTYGKKRFDFTYKTQLSGTLPGGKFIRLGGEINLPGAAEQGSFSFTFFTGEAAKGIFLAADVKYPFTPERDAISTENSTLGRYTDMKWQEAAPLCIAYDCGENVSVIKRNFEGGVSSFRTASYGEADRRNSSLDSFNNQLAAGLTGIAGSKGGLLIGNARCVLSSMAFCPMRLEKSGRVLMNPFGTFYGRQRHHINQSGDRIPLTYTLIAPQGKSLAPSYNGYSERFVLCLMPFDGEMTAEGVPADLTAFADGALVTGSDGILSPYAGENVRMRSQSTEIENIKIRSPLLTGIKGNAGKYAVRGVKAVSYIARRQHSAKKGK